MTDHEKKHKKESKLTGLYVQKDKIKKTLDILVKKRDSIDQQIKGLNKKLDGIRSGIDYFENRDILITTHFIARYTQRVGPATEQEMREHILTPQLLNMIRTLGNGTYPVHQYMVRVEDGKLITIMLSENKKK